MKTKHFVLLMILFCALLAGVGCAPKQEPFAVIDAVDAEYALVEHVQTGAMFYINLSDLYVPVREGDVINYDLSFNEKETFRRQSQIRRQLEELTNKEIL